MTSLIDGDGCSEDRLRMAVKAWPVIEVAAGLQLAPYDLVGVYILALAAARGRSWSSGRLKARVAAEVGLSVAIANVPGLLDLLGGAAYLSKKLCRAPRVVESLTVIDVFNELGLSNLKNNDGGFNVCMVQWSLGRRPCRLMSSIPTSVSVLRQQALGERVVSIFLTFEELSQLQSSPLMYMKGFPVHSRDALDFTLHDLLHMENFANELSHVEQRGFFTCMLRLCDAHDVEAGPREFFIDTCGLDELLWSQLEYAISDMNCFVPHLLEYVLAKITAAVSRQAIESSADGTDQQKQKRVQEIWGLLLDRIGMQQGLACRQAAEKMLVTALKQGPEVDARVAPRLSVDERECLRSWFQAQAQI